MNNSEKPEKPMILEDDVSKIRALLNEEERVGMLKEAMQSTAWC